MFHSLVDKSSTLATDKEIHGRQYVISGSSKRQDSPEEQHHLLEGSVRDPCGTVASVESTQCSDSELDATSEHAFAVTPEAEQGLVATPEDIDTASVMNMKTVEDLERELVARITSKLDTRSPPGSKREPPLTFEFADLLEGCDNAIQKKHGGSEIPIRDFRVASFEQSTGNIICSDLDRHELTEKRCTSQAAPAQNHLSIHDQQQNASSLDVEHKPCSKDKQKAQTNTVVELERQLTAHMATAGPASADLLPHAKKAEVQRRDEGDTNVESDVPKFLKVEDLERALLPDALLPTLDRAKIVPALSLGSMMHANGTCRPCAWFWKPQSCQNGQWCRHCHLCPAGEARARKTVKKMALRAAVSSSGSLETKQEAESTMSSRKKSQEETPKENPASAMTMHLELQSSLALWGLPHISQALSGPTHAATEVPMLDTDVLLSPDDTALLENISEHLATSVGTRPPRSILCRPDGEQLLLKMLQCSTEDRVEDSYQVDEVDVAEPEATTRADSDDVVQADELQLSGLKREISALQELDHVARSESTQESSAVAEQALALRSLNPGSALHSSGACRPCAWYWKRFGCWMGESCLHCHECPEGELKVRKKTKMQLLRKCQTTEKHETTEVKDGGEMVTSSKHARSLTSASKHDDPCASEVLPMLVLAAKGAGDTEDDEELEAASAAAMERPRVHQLRDLCKESRIPRDRGYDVEAQGRPSGNR